MNGRAAHNERLKLIERWDETVETLKRRDQNIEDATERLKTKLQAVEEMESASKQLASGLETEMHRHKQLDTQLQTATRELVIDESISGVTVQLGAVEGVLET